MYGVLICLAVAGLDGSAVGVAPLRADREERPLPAAAERVCVGGGGRFLILHLPRSKTLAVFDATRAKVVKYLPVDDDAKFAAGLDYLIVSSPAKQVLHQYTLATLERTLTVVMPAGGPVLAVGMGSRSTGPLAVRLGRPGGQSVVVLLDPRTLGPADRKFASNSDGGGGTLLLSADGRLIATGGVLWTLDGRTYRRRADMPAAVPGADDRIVMDNGRRFTADGQLAPGPAAGHGKMVWFVPVSHPVYQFSLAETHVLNNGRQFLAPGVHLGGDPLPIARTAELDATAGLIDWHSGYPEPFHQHVFPLPDARLVVVLPRARDKLVLYRLDLDGLLATVADYLFFESQPPSTAVRGATYTYPAVVRSKAAGATVTVESGPAGMGVGPGARLTWPVPADYADAEADVILKVRDANGREEYQTFTLDIRPAARR